MPEPDLVARVDGRDLESATAEQQRTHGQPREARAARQLEVHVDVGAGQHGALRVVGLELDEHRARALADGLRRVADRGHHGLVRALGDLQARRDALVQQLRIGLWHLDVDAQPARIGNAKQLLARAGAGVDERTDVRPAGRHDAAEGRDDRLEGRGRAQARNVGLGRRDDGRPGGVVAELLVGLLLRDRIRLEHPLPARRGRGRQLLVGARGGEVRLDLQQLLIELGRLDLCEQLAGVHGRADVDVPALEIAVDARVDRRVDVRPHRAGQHQLTRRRALAHGHERHGRNRLLARPARYVHSFVDAQPDAGDRRHERDDERHEASDAQPAP